MSTGYCYKDLASAQTVHVMALNHLSDKHGLISGMRHVSCQLPSFLNNHGFSVADVSLP